MQLSWIWRGLRTGIVTTRYPKTIEAMPERWRGLVRLDIDKCRVDGAVPICVRVCLPGALTVSGASDAGPGRLRLDAGACIACGLCVVACPEGALSMDPSFELATRSRAALVTESTASRSRSDGETG